MNISLHNKTVLVTGAAGFIGSFLSEELLRKFEGIHVVGIDSMNDYYEVSLKEYRLEKLEKVAREREAKGCRLIDKAPRRGAEGLNIAFLHPKSTVGTLIELCEDPNK